MGRRASTVLLLLGFLAGALGSTGCFEFEKEPQPHTPPTTFFNGTPPDTTFRNAAFFQWIGTDLDSDVVAFQFQLVETDSVYFETGGQVGGVIRSIDPMKRVASSMKPMRISAYRVKAASRTQV